MFDRDQSKRDNCNFIDIRPPFYVFDEIDANLDNNYSSKVYEMIKESGSQYFISSFKEESLVCGDKFFMLSSQNKESYVAEVDRMNAVEWVSSK